MRGVVSAFPSQHYLPPCKHATTNVLTNVVGSIFTLTGLSGLSFPDSVPILSSEPNSSFLGATSANFLFSANDENSSIWNSVTGTLKLILRPRSTLLKGELYRFALNVLIKVHSKKDLFKFLAFGPSLNPRLRSLIYFLFFWSIPQPFFPGSKSPCCYWIDPDNRSYVS